MLKAIYLLSDFAYDVIYGAPEREAISNLVEIYAPQQTKESIQTNPKILHEAEIILSGWGMATLDEAFLGQVPNLKAIFYGAGTLRDLVTEAFWHSGITITSSYAANAVPVTEYTLSQILFSLKRGWQYALQIKERQQYVEKVPTIGNYDSTVGLVSLGMIGRGVVERLKPFDHHIIAYDPFVTVDEGQALGVEMCSLEQVFAQADVVSLHTPWTPETVGLITGDLIGSMKPNGTLINTARGAIVNEPEMIAVLKNRPDLFAILDVTYPEPPEVGSQLYNLPNVILTPHIAGSHNQECRRMGKIVVDQLQKFINGEPLEWAITEAQAKIMA
ncbi:MAG: hydroxyacid dehydrogenase [Chloroflexota bacterium]